MDDRKTIHSSRRKVFPAVLVGIAVVLTALLVYDAIEAVRTLETGYFPNFLFTTYIQSLRRLPRNWEMAAVAALPALSLLSSGLVASWGFAARFGRCRRFRYLLLAAGVALLVADVASCYLIRKAYIAV